MNTTLIIGLFGSAIILIFFLLEQTHKISNESIWYDGGNFIGSALLVVYAILLSSIPFLILNGVWAIFSLKDVFIDLKRLREKKIPEV
jgi:hypothetical protein